MIEHLTAEQLRHARTHARLASGRWLIAETVNPHSPPALKTFWVDLTHQHPIFPEVALEFCREAGFPPAFFFTPTGRETDHDRFVQGEFAVVATAVGEGQPLPAQGRDETVMAASRRPRAGNGSA